MKLLNKKFKNLLDQEFPGILPDENVDANNQGIKKAHLWGDQYNFYNLHRAAHEGNIKTICDEIELVRIKVGLPCLSALERQDAAIFYSEYLRQHPADGILRMAQFINVTLEHYL